MQFIDENYGTIMSLIFIGYVIIGILLVDVVKKLNKE